MAHTLELIQYRAVSHLASRKNGGNGPCYPVRLDIHILFIEGTMILSSAVDRNIIRKLPWLTFVMRDILGTLSQIRILIDLRLMLRL